MVTNSQRDSDDGVTDAFGSTELDDRSEPEQLGRLLEETTLSWRKEFVDFDDEDAQRLADLESLFREHQDELADRFYDNVLEYDETNAVVDRSERSIEALKDAQRAYLHSLATGDYGEAYFRNRARIGMHHATLEVPMAQYVGQYTVYYEVVLSMLEERMQREVVAAAEEWAASELESADSQRDGLFTGEFSVYAETDYSRSGEDEFELSESFESALREAIHEGMQDVLSVLRLTNLDMQMAADAYDAADRVGDDEQATGTDDERSGADTARTGSTSDGESDETGQSEGVGGLADEISDILDGNT